jgi:hypothetical protein
MNVRLLSLLAILASSGFSAASFADELPDYVRFAEDARSARLEVAIRTFVMPSGKTVDLIGVVHIADGAYYRQLNERFDAYDSVLFELIGDPERLTGAQPPGDAQQPLPPGAGALSVIQQAAGDYLDLSFQLTAIDYTGKNMVHADATREEFARMQRERGETTATLFARAMQAQMVAEMGNPKSSAAAREFDTFGLLRILLSRDSAAAFKKALAKTFDQMESMTALMEGDDRSAVLSGRNEVVVNKIKEVLALKKQRRIAVFYGGAHMPGIEASLIKEMKAKASGEEWLAAWTMPKPGDIPAAGASPIPRK